jgi:hypothetical protein
MPKLSAKFAYPLIVAVCLAGAQGSGPKQPRQLKHLGSNAQFPALESYLVDIRDKQLSREIRFHAWDIFAGLTRESIPVWESWDTKCDLDLAKCAKTADSVRHNIMASIAIPVQSLDAIASTRFPINNPAAPDKNRIALPIQNLIEDLKKRPQFASVFFDPQAAKHIVDQKLASKEHLFDLLSMRERLGSPQAEREIPPFPRDSIVIKTAWQVIHPGNTVLVWSPSEWANKRAPRTPVPGFYVDEWHNWVNVDFSLHSKCEDREYPDHATVPLDCFYYYRVNDSDLPYINSVPSKFIFDLGSKIYQPTYLILVAVHITTKETPEWDWATFWWSNRSRDIQFGADRPSFVKGNKWRHFLMDTTLSRMTPRDSLDGKNKICFNPYLEEEFTNGIVSNCLECHSRAAYRDPEDTTTGKNAYDISLDARDNPVKNPDGYFDHTLQLDFLWSLSDQSNTQKLLQQIDLALQ